MRVALGDRVKLKGVDLGFFSPREKKMKFKVVAMGTFPGETEKRLVIQRESGRGHSGSMFRNKCKDAVYYHPRFAAINYEGYDLYYINQHNILEVIKKKGRRRPEIIKPSNNLFNIDDL